MIIPSDTTKDFSDDSASLSLLNSVQLLGTEHLALGQAVGHEWGQESTWILCQATNTSMMCPELRRKWSGCSNREERGVRRGHFS